MNPQLTQDFHKQFYQSINWRKDLSYRGVPILKNPLDLFIEQEIIYETQPDVIIETGTAYGGSALYYADLLEKIGSRNLVITIDIKNSNYIVQYEALKHPRILFLDHGSLDISTFDRLKTWIGPEQSVMVILDSDHHKDHVLAELRAYSSFVTPGCYLIVEDSNTDLVLEDYGPGPSDAVNEFLSYTTNFKCDKSREKFGLTFNSWLKKCES